MKEKDSVCNLFIDKSNHWFEFIAYQIQWQMLLVLATLLAPHMPGLKCIHWGTNFPSVLWVVMILRRNVAVDSLATFSAPMLYKKFGSIWPLEGFGDLWLPSLLF